MPKACIRGTSSQEGAIPRHVREGVLIQKYMGLVLPFLRLFYLVETD